jgi:osmotically-inducible protein OsmY
VIAIAQEITVSDTWRGINDSDIATEAGDALSRNVVVPASVKATVQNHVITLSGEVEWQYQREASGYAVHHLKGVKGVHNLIAIRPKVRAGDLKTVINEALVRHAQLDSATIGVATSQSGAVTLRGTVRSWAEREQAENACWAAPGITAVDNGLRVIF